VVDLSHHLEANLFYQNEKASSSAKKRTGGSCFENCGVISVTQLSHLLPAISRKIRY
jgi:hypothetical protein